MVRANSQLSPPSPGAERREELITVASRVFAEKGYANATVREIGSAAGGVGSLYSHFDSKEALLEAVLTPVYEALLAEYHAVAERGGEPSEALEELVTVGLRFVVEQPQAARILQNDLGYLRSIERFAFLAERHTEVRQVWHSVLAACQANGSVRADVDWSILYRHLTGTIQSTARWFDPAGRVDAPTAIAEIAKMLLRGIGSETTAARP